MITPAADHAAPRRGYQLRIDLLDSDPPIWRSLWVQADTPLATLPPILAAAMGWSGSAEAYLKMTHGPNDGSDLEGVNLAAVLQQPGDCLRYTYAPALGWLHRVCLEAVAPIPEEEFLPRCIAGERHCPPEFCAGVWGYEDLLDRLNDPEDPDYEQLWQQVGYDFDPETFDLTAVNQRLQTLGP
ncbi:MAG: plasmid pRiA4b ORF-3 family protein [Leptolyngbya sp.]|nr:plasmid pRiA4b ORF-3 family protein [Leptolyngbya sp.]